MINLNYKQFGHGGDGGFGYGGYGSDGGFGFGFGYGYGSDGGFGYGLGYGGDAYGGFGYGGYAYGGLGFGDYSITTTLSQLKIILWNLNLKNINDRLPNQQPNRD